MPLEFYLKYSTDLSFHMKKCTNAGVYKELFIFRVIKSLLEISTPKNNLENLEKQGNVAVCDQECFLFYPQFQGNSHEYLLFLSPIISLWVFSRCF